MSGELFSGRYRVDRHVASGGMAEVYLAHDDRLGREVAVKVLPSSLARDPSFVERFRREAKSAAGLNHPHIVSVYDFGEDDGSYFIVMEYVPGETLRDVIGREGALPPATALRIAADVAAALEAAHRRGIIHRDIKPANVLIADGVVKVTDFGIARAEDVRESITIPGAIIGTATYLSPEQAQGTDVDHRSDLYSLGMVLYEMLTGQPPFGGGTALAVAVRQLNETPRPPSSLNGAVGPRVDAVVTRAMAMAPLDRPASATELRDELLALVDEEERAGEQTTVLAAGAPMAASAAATTVMAASTDSAATAMLASTPPPTSDGAGPRPPGPRPGGRPGPDVYRRRRIGALAAAGLVVVALIVLIGLAIGGGDGDGNSAATTVGVPDVIGRTVDEATAALSQAGLQATVVPRPADGPPDRVVDQKPAPNTQVERGTIVSVFVPAVAETTTTSSTRPPVTAAPSTTRTTSTTAATVPSTTTTTRPITTTTRRPTTTTGTVTVPTTAAP